MHGAIAMKPLVLREIADELGLHESTISRVTTAKYMSTPFGTFELKYFFGSSLNTEAGGNASSTAVRALIKQIVAAEDPAKPLSDSQISQMLEEQGIQVRAPHGGQVPRGAEDRAGQPAQGDVSADAVAAVPALRRRRRGVAGRGGARASLPQALRASRRAAASRCRRSARGDALNLREPARAARAGRGRARRLPQRGRPLRRSRARVRLGRLDHAARRRCASTSPRSAARCRA